MFTSVESITWVRQLVKVGPNKRLFSNVEVKVENNLNKEKFFQMIARY